MFMTVALCAVGALTIEVIVGICIIHRENKNLHENRRRSNGRAQSFRRKL